MAGMRWCELLVDIEAQDLKEYLQFATCSNGRLQYASIDPQVYPEDSFKEDVRATLPPRRVEEPYRYVNDAGTPYDMNKFKVSMKVRREYITAMMDDVSSINLLST